MAPLAHPKHMADGSLPLKPVHPTAEFLFSFMFRDCIDSASKHMLFFN